MRNKHYISTNGYEKLTNEIKKLKSQADEVVLQIKENRQTETGDESENVEMMRLMSEREAISEKFHELEEFLYSCDVVDISKLPQETKTVRFGTTVRLLELNTNKEFTYTILGDKESRISDHTISYLSPLAKSLIGETVGKIICVDVPCGEREFKIISVIRHKVIPS